MQSSHSLSSVATTGFPLAGRVNGWLLPLFALALPLSTSALSVLAVLIVCTWLLTGHWPEKWVEISTHPVCRWLGLYLLLFAVGLLWSPAPDAGLAVLADRWKLALLPVFLTAAQYRHRGLYVNGFLAGMTIAMLLTYLAWFDLVHYADVTPEHLTRKTTHVVYNPLLALAVYLLLHQVIWEERGRLDRGLRLLLAAAMVFNMFITEGRAGQMVFFVLLALLIVQVFRHRLGRALATVALVLPLVFAGAYFLSPTFQERLEQAWQEAATCRRNPETSIGYRLLYWRNSWQIIREHPLLGVGTGGFVPAYAAVNERETPRIGPTDNPHNQYILVTTMFGVPGLAVLLGMFWSMIRLAGRADPWHRLRLAFPVFFLTIMLTESYLKVYETGLLFAFLGGVLYKEKETGDSGLHTVQP